VSSHGFDEAYIFTLHLHSKCPLSWWWLMLSLIFHNWISSPWQKKKKKSWSLHCSLCFTVTTSNTFLQENLQEF
jgi:hypothetical protein